MSCREGGGGGKGAGRGRWFYNKLLNGLNGEPQLAQCLQPPAGPDDSMVVVVGGWGDGAGQGGAEFTDLKENLANKKQCLG